ncbi:hypothetical protein NBRC10513v2_002054 [Rhodotorula toruloides]
MPPARATYYRIPGDALPRPTTQPSRGRRPHPRTLALAGLAVVSLVYLLSRLRLSQPTAQPAAVASDDTAPSLDSDLPKTATQDESPVPTRPTEIAFNSRLPCNDLTETFVPSTSLAHLSLPSLQRWVSPSPPLPPSTPLEARLSDWSSAPTAPYSDWLRFNKQTCGNPSTRRNRNNLHARDNQAAWEDLGGAEVQRLRSEFRAVLVDAETAGRFEDWRKSDRKGTRGLVWTAGNADTFERSLVSLRLLRKSYNCSLPAQIFHFTSETPSPEQAAEFESLGARVLALQSLDKEEGQGRTKSFHLKGGAIVDSAFDEVLLLDSDNIPARDPTFLFESAEFREMGVILWPDFFKDQPENAIWSILGIQCRDEFTVEAGQVLVRKSDHFDALLLVEHMLKDWRFWFQFSDGDKDLFRYALLALRKRWAIPARHLSSASWTDEVALGAEHEHQFAGHTMVQYGLASEGLPARPLFVHANLLKRVVSNLENGNTFGRTLQLRLPLSAGHTSSSSGSPQPSDVPPIVLSADHLANTSPITGVGIAQPAERAAVPDWVRTRAVLERGLSMHFWDGHRGAAYVLAVESEWSDELRSLALRGPADTARDGHEAEEAEHEQAVAGPWEVEGMDQEEWEEWARWVTQEREAPCTREAGNLRAALLLEKQSTDLPDERVAAAPEEERMEVVLWEQDEDLRDFEQRFYGVGRGSAGGHGFR